MGLTANDEDPRLSRELVASQRRGTGYGAMDAQARRERRQARIKAGGTERLAKITKVSNPDGPDYKGEYRV